MWFMRHAGGYWKADHTKQELILFNILHEKVEYETGLEVMDQAESLKDLTRRYQKLEVDHTADGRSNSDLNIVIRTVQ